MYCCQLFSTQGHLEFVYSRPLYQNHISDGVAVWSWEWNDIKSLQIMSRNRTVQSVHIFSIWKISLPSWGHGWFGAQFRRVKIYSRSSVLFTLLFNTQPSIEALPNPFPDSLRYDYQIFPYVLESSLFFPSQVRYSPQHENKNCYCFPSIQCISP